MLNLCKSIAVLLLRNHTLIKHASFIECFFLRLAKDHICCDALRCSGPHARYTDRVSEFYSQNSPWPEGLGNLVKPGRAGDRALQLLLVNEEFLVVVIHQIATITSLPFVHTARRYYRLNGLVRLLDRLRKAGNGSSLSRS